jgi:hypothetical protein
MKQFSFDELGRKDFFIGLVLWIVIELVSFLVLPGLGVIQSGPRLKTWFFLSLPFGVAGAFLLGISSRFIALTQERGRGPRSLQSFLGQFGGGIGIAGIVFPFVMVTLEFFAKIFVK